MSQEKELVNHLFRSQYGKLVSIATRYLGASRLNLAEDVVQDTLISALNHWSVHGTPKKPIAWLTTVAKRKALNVLRKNKVTEKHLDSLDAEALNEDGVETFLDHEIEDSQCVCHLLHPKATECFQGERNLGFLREYGVATQKNHPQLTILDFMI